MDMHTGSRAVSRRRLMARGESGQLVTGLVLLGSLFAVFAIGILLLPLGAATTERSAAQAAADSAALAGATEVMSELRGQLNGSFSNLDKLFGTLSSPGTCEAGRIEAEDFARRNGAAVTDYCADWVHATVRASVRMSSTATSGAGAKATATASIGFDPSLCVMPVDFPPTPSPSPTSTPTPSSTSPSSSPTTTTTPPPPPPPSDAETDIDCGPVSLHVVFNGASGTFRLSPLSQLDDFDPRLTK